jgi:hypothetical protein
MESAFGKNIVLTESVTARMDHMQECLCGPNPTALEQVLVERILVCWLSLYIIELAAASETGMNTLIPQADCRQRRLNAASTRLNAACVALARVKRLAKPRINAILNVAAGGPTQINVNERATDL